MKMITAADPESRSADLLADNVGKLRELFPQVFTEGKVDFQVLRELLGDAVEEREERYGLNWHGKAQARRLALTPSTGTLRPMKEESVDWDTTQNLIIEGDNLEVLKLLQKSYAGKVKLIYIDPPYNTGKDFVYPDNFRDGMEAYLRLTGQVDSDGGATSTNTEASGRYHTDWLNMLYPRLLLARQLLMADGLILVSIDDREVHNTRHLLDSVFGSENFLAQLVWKTDGNFDNQARFKRCHEYVLVYGKVADEVAPPPVVDPNAPRDSKLFRPTIRNTIVKNGPKNPVSRVLLPTGFPADFEYGTISLRNDKYPRYESDAVVSGGRLTAPVWVSSGWSSRGLLDAFISGGFETVTDAKGQETRFALATSGAIEAVKKRSEYQSHVVSVLQGLGGPQKAAAALNELNIVFEGYPKPVELLAYLLQFVGGSDGLFLDFFAGSGTCAEAVYRLNAEDSGARRFVLVQLPMPLDPSNKQQAHAIEFCSKRGMPPLLSELTKERLRKSSVKYRSALPALTEELDFGFRVFKLDSTNLKPWDPTRSDLQTQLGEHVDHIKSDRTEDDLLHEVLLKLGIDLSVPIETRTIAGFEVHNIGAGQLLACFSTPIRRVDATPLARGITAWHDESRPEAADAAASTATLLFRDAAFEDDVAKQNLVHALEQAGLTNVRSL